MLSYVQIYIDMDYRKETAVFYNGARSKQMKKEIAKVLFFAEDFPGLFYNEQEIAVTLYLLYRFSENIRTVKYSHTLFL